MSKRSALVVAVAVGFSLWGCSDDKAGPGVGPDTSWQVLCAKNDPTMSCSTSEKPHGPLDGRDPADKSDDYTLNVVTCSNTGSGLSIKIDDPGRPRDPNKGIEPRPHSILEITRAKLDSNECQVKITEYPLNESGPRPLQEGCAGNTSSAGSCELKGEFNSSNGYAFEGTVTCDGLKYNGQGPAAWALRAAAPNNAEPVTIQISHCDGV